MWMDDPQDLWEDFSVYVTKLKKMIIKIHNKEELFETDQFSKAEYGECYR